jgi:hypothetical protein
LSSAEAGYRVTGARYNGYLPIGAREKRTIQPVMVSIVVGLGGRFSRIVSEGYAPDMTLRTSRVVLLAAGVVVIAALSKKWFTPGDIYVPPSSESVADSDPEKP